MELQFILLIAVICIAIGFLAGQMVSSLGKEKQEGEKDSNEETLKNQVRLWDDPDGNTLIVEMDEKTYRRSSQLDAEQRERVQKTILKLNRWLEYTSPILMPKEETIPQETPTLEAPVSEITQPRLSFNPVGMLVNALKADVPKSKLPTESIVQQIDDVLQAKLRNSPLKDEGIRLMDWPGTGMVVMIGMDRYENLDEVPNAEIRELIKSAVQEWEQNS